MSTSDTTVPTTGPRSVPRLFKRLVIVLFPFLSVPARIAAAVLTAAMILTTVLAWMGTLGGAGISSGLRPVPMFAALVLTGTSIAAATLPRYAYNWLEKRGWPADDFAFGDLLFPVVGSHVILLGLQIILLNLSENHPSSQIMAGVAAVGVVLWIVHEALRAYRIHQEAVNPDKLDQGLEGG